MTYNEIANIAQDGALTRRIVACAYLEKLTDPPQWVADHMWPLAASPGWVSAWASARASHEDDHAYLPGADEAVITDQMILSAVQALAAA